MIIALGGFFFFHSISDMEDNAKARVQQQIEIMTNAVETKIANEESRIDRLIDAKLETDNVDKLVNDKVQTKVNTVTTKIINDAIHSQIDPSLYRVANELAKIETNLYIATSTGTQVKDGLDVALTIVAALNDDRQAFERLLDAWEPGTNSYHSTINAAVNAILSQEQFEDISLSVATWKVPNLTTTNGWEDCMKIFNSLPPNQPMLQSMMLRLLSVRTNLPEYNKLVLYLDILEHTESLELLSRTCKILSLETPSSMNILGYPTYIEYLKQKIAPMTVTNITEMLRTNKNNVLLYLQRGAAYVDSTNYTLAMKDFKKALLIESTNAEAQNAYAWFLATCPDVRVRDGHKAMELATQACRTSNWKTWYDVGTLAAAYAETGDFTNAIKYVKQTMATPGIQDYERRRELVRLKQYEEHKAVRQ